MDNVIKHRWLAKLISIFLQLGFGFLIIAFVINLMADLFNVRKYIHHNNWTLGTVQEGYKLKASLFLNIPDTIKRYKNGEQRISSNYIGIKNKYLDDLKRQKTEVVVNKFNVLENQEIAISNHIWVADPIEIYVNSSKLIHRVFWSFYTQLDLLFSIFFFLLLIKLLNRYTNNRMFEQKTFKLIAGFGWLMIGKQVVLFTMSMINGKIIGPFYFSSINTMTNKSYKNTDLHVNFYNGFTFSNVGIGLMILLLAYVMKAAIVAKTENDLTV